MPTCVKCRKDWPDGFAACPDDGSPLVAADLTIPDGDLARAGTVSAPAAEPAADEALLQPGTAVGEYVIEGKLGEGGMGAVYSATHPVIGKQAAITVLSRSLCAEPAAVERFQLEARAG